MKDVTYFILGTGVLAAIYIISCFIGYSIAPYVITIHGSELPSNVFHLIYCLVGLTGILFAIVASIIPICIGKTIIDGFENKEE